jgi:hypothetical protein
MNSALFVIILLGVAAISLTIWSAIYTRLTGKPFITFSSGQEDTTVDDVAISQASEKARETAIAEPRVNVVDFKLGNLERLWHPVLYSVLVMVLFFGSCFASVALVRVLGRHPLFFADPVWWVILIGLIAFTHGTLSALNNARHQRVRLGVHEHGVRFGKSSLRFDEIAAVAVGGFKTAHEKNFPILECIREFRYPNYAIAKDKMRAMTLDLKRKDGTTCHWFGLMGMFHPSEIAAFLEILVERAPEESMIV